jgi:hypothetical protein
MHTKIDKNEFLNGIKIMKNQNLNIIIFKIKKLYEKQKQRKDNKCKTA